MNNVSSVHRSVNRLTKQTGLSGSPMSSMGRPQLASRHASLSSKDGTKIDHQTGSASWDIGTRFGERLRQLRRAHRMTQLDMAILLGIDRSFISEVECAKKGISLELLEVIALGFHLTLSDLFRDI